MNAVKIGATTDRIGANAVAKLFCSCVSADIIELIEALVDDRILGKIIDTCHDSTVNFRDQTEYRRI